MARYVDAILFWVMDHWPVVHFNKTMTEWRNDTHLARQDIEDALRRLEHQGEDGIHYARGGLYRALERLS